MWSRVIITRVLDEMLYTKPEDLSEKYANSLEIDSDYFAPEGTNIKSKPISVEIDAEDPENKIEDDEDDM